MSEKRIRISLKEATVLWLLLNHGNLSDQQIADLAGCSRTSLYRMPFFKTVRRLLRETGASLLPCNSSDHGYEPVLRDNDDLFNDVLE